MLEIVIGAFLAAVVWGAARMWLKAHKRRMEWLRFHRGQFFIHAEKTLKNGSADDAMLVRLKSMALTIDDSRQIRPLAEAITAFDNDMRLGKYKPPEKEPPDEWSALVFNYFLALSYLKGIRGVFLRAALAQVLEPSVGGKNTEIIDRRVRSTRLQPA